MVERFLGDSDIELWNKRLSTTIKGGQGYSLHNNKGDISISKSSDWGMNIPHVSIESESNLPKFEYIFSFSVVKKRRDDLFKIIEIFLKDGFSIVNNYINQVNIDKIKSLIDSGIINDHKIYENDMIRYQYHFNDHIFNIIGSVTIIEDAIHFLSQMWGYDENGNEIYMLKYPIGSIVSLSDKKDIDCMIIGYQYKRRFVLNNHIDNKSEILYSIICIESELNSTVIKYGKALAVKESEIIPSRSNNINIILN